jgi:glycosyltransferase involved in cell wall biosynthesis
MRLALIVTTYERPDALAAVLASVARQHAAPDELIVADDGSGATTRAVIDQYARDSATPVRHAWQEHDGFRLTRLRNIAIVASTADYLVFVDGDMLLHPDFIADHRRIARRGWFTQGARILLDEARTGLALQQPSARLGPWSPGLGGLRRVYAVHAPRGARALRRAANHVIAIKGCNQGFWRDDLVAANGFDESIVGWGPEDKELCARLVHAGVRRQTLLFGGIAFHLHHPAASRARVAANQRVLADTLALRRTRCDAGLDRHDPPADSAARA